MWIASSRSGSGRSGLVDEAAVVDLAQPAAGPLDDPVAQRGRPRVDARGRSPGDLGEDVLGDVEVGGHALDVVEVLEQLDEPERLARLVESSSTVCLAIIVDSAESTLIPEASSAWRTLEVAGVV